MEKASFKKIQNLLEISEWERHHKILLTTRNLRELSRSPSPYIIPVIPRPLPTEIVEEEHYVIADLLNLAPSSLSPTKTSKTKVVGRELVISIRPEQPSLAREDSDLVPQASKEDDRVSHFERLPFIKKGSRPAPQASKKGRRVSERPRTLEAGVEDFVPWVPLISSCPPAREEEEEEDKMDDLVHYFGEWKLKRGANFKRAIDATPKVVGKADQHPSGENLDVQAIVVSDSPEMGFHGQSASETSLLANLGEVFLTHAKVQENIPSEQIASRPNKATSTRAGRSRPLLPDRLLLNFYIPPQGQAPPIEEVSDLGPEGSQEIINRWNPFNRGESPAAHMHQLYPTLLRMPVAVWTKGKGKEYAVPIPAYACKDKLKQVVEDGMLIRNRNFIQSAKLVCLQLLCTILLSLPSYCLILIRSFLGHYDYPEYDLPTSRVPVSAEGCREATALCSVGRC